MLFFEREKRVTDGGDLLGRVSLLRTFINVIAGTGAVFAALHVIIGYIDFKGKLNAATGETPKFFDEKEYRYYLILAGFFLLTMLVSALSRRLPAVTIFPAMGTATYVMLLFDESILTAGRMTFLMFSLFIFAGFTALAFYHDEQSGDVRARQMVCVLGLLVGILALTIYFRAPKAAEDILTALKPDADIEGERAARAYQRLKALSELFESTNHVSYLRVGLLHMITALVIFFFPKIRFIGRTLSVISLGYVVVQFFAEKLEYFPMFYAMPMVLVFFGYQTFYSGSVISVFAKAEPQLDREAEAESSESEKAEEMPADEEDLSSKTPISAEASKGATE